MKMDEISALTPRSVRRTAWSHINRGVLVFILVAGLWTLCRLATRDLTDLNALQARGKPIQALIYGREVEHGKSDSYYLQYHYAADRLEVWDSVSVSKWRYDQTASGQTLTVTYLPGHPVIHRTGTVNQVRIDNQRIGWIAGNLFFAVIFGISLLAVEREFNREYGLLRDGVVTTAVIREMKPVRAGDSSFNYGASVTYFFEVRPDEEASGTVTFVSSAVRGLEPGFTLQILYDPVRPAINSPVVLLGSVELA
ncbi:MAG: hypothetical protein LC772_05170 [Chloroflexi bacterium]|nr:hypothetical protein [Chloroflexota bacterium]